MIKKTYEYSNGDIICTETQDNLQVKKVTKIPMSKANYQLQLLETKINNLKTELLVVTEEKKNFNLAKIVGDRIGKK